MQRTDTRVHSCVNMYVSDCTTTVPLSDHRGTSGCIYMCMIIVYPYEVLTTVLGRLIILVTAPEIGGRIRERRSQATMGPTTFLHGEIIVAPTHETRGNLPDRP